VIGSGASLLLGLVVRSVIARVYGSEGMGEYAGFMMFLSLFGTIAAFSLPRAVLKFAAEYEESDRLDRARTLFSTVFIFITATCLLVAVGAYFFTPQLGKLIKLEINKSLTFFLCGTLLLATYSVLASTFFLGLLRNLRAFAISLLSMVTMLVMAAVAYFIKPFPVYYLLVGGYAVSGTFGLALVWRNGFLLPAFSGRELKKAFAFALPLLLISYLAFFVEWFDRFTLGMYFGVKEMGIFSAGLVIFVTARKLPISLTEVLVPSYSKISVHGKEVLERAFNKNIRFYAVVFFFISAVLILYRYELILLLAGHDRFAEFSPAAGVILILSFSFILSVITNPGSSLLVGSGRTRLNSLNFAIGVFALIPALFFFTRKWGLSGAAGAKVLAHIVTTGGMLVILMKVLRLKVDFRPICKLLIFSAAVLGAIAIVKYSFSGAIWLTAPSLLLIYWGGIWILILDEEDKKYVREIWMNIRTGKEIIREPGVNWETPNGDNVTDTRTFSK